jgi:hypothetical protein
MVKHFLINKKARKNARQTLVEGEAESFPDALELPPSSVEDDCSD